MKKDQPEPPHALHSLCASASEQAESWRTGPCMSWTEARAASLSASRRKRLQKVGIILGSGLLTLGVLASQFGGEPASPSAPVTMLAIPTAQTATSLTPADAGNTAAFIGEVAAPGAVSGGDPRTPFGAAPAELEAAEPPASAESESQPDGSC